MNINVVLCGMGGYGALYAEQLLENASPRGVTLAGIVEPYPERCAHYARAVQLGVRVYPSLESFYAQSRADLAIISSPIGYHLPQTELALANGSHVLLEKPVCATCADARRMLAAQKRAGLLVDVGYQWSHSAAVQALKADVLSGVLGAPKLLKVRVLWPRDAAYYARGTGWAGRRTDALGQNVRDSVAMNATAHYLFNMLYVLGDAPFSAASPTVTRALLYRANPIEMFDTAAIEMTTPGGARALYYASHAVEREDGPLLHYAFEKGDVYCDVGHAPSLRAALSGGDTREYGDPNADVMAKLWHMVAAVRGEGPIYCGIEAAAMHAQALDQAEAMGEIRTFESERLRLREKLTYVDGLYETLIHAYERNCVPDQL